MSRRRMMYGSKKEEPLPEITYVKGWYISEYGVFTKTSGWYYTNFIPVHPGDKVSHKGYVGAACSGICVENNGTLTNKVTGSGSSSYKTYTWIADADCNVGFSGKFGSPLPKFYLNDVELVITNP